MLLTPLVQAFEALVPAAEKDIERAWAQQVRGPWNALATRYPFADGAVEAALADIQKFLKPGEGTLHRFVDTHLGALVTLQGDRLVPRYWTGKGVAFSEDFLRNVSRLLQASTSLHETVAARFELQPVPSPGMREIVLEIDGQKLHYRNGPQTWTAFTWPGSTTLQGARIQVVAVDGATVQVHNGPGRLGLLRLLDQARVEEGGPSTQTLEWSLKPVQGYEPARIRFNYRMVSGHDPLLLSALRHHSLPARATR
jgi:type VI secretion system protein ImpL